MNFAELRVQVIGHTVFVAPQIGEDENGPVYWDGAHESNRDMSDGRMGPEWAPFPESALPGRAQSLLEFAGRSCYESYHRPNARTASNKGYLANILEAGHHSVLEHASVTFYITGISRSLTHELIRHRHFSFSELSQRYVDVATASLVVPPAFEDHEDGQLVYAGRNASKSYDLVAETLQENGVKGKKVREAARAVMPNMTETKMVLTGNYRALIHFLKMRDSVHADAEIQRLAQEIGRLMAGIAPNVFGGPARAIWQDNSDAA